MEFHLFCATISADLNQSCSDIPAPQPRPGRRHETWRPVKEAKPGPITFLAGFAL